VIFTANELEEEGCKEIGSGALHGGAVCASGFKSGWHVGSVERRVGPNDEPTDRCNVSYVECGRLATSAVSPCMNEVSA
jgi:hypothetical protein